MSKSVYSPFPDFFTFSVFLDSVIEGLDFTEAVDIDGYKLLGAFRSAFSDQNFRDGAEKASCFKKVSAFMCYFVAESPLSSKEHPANSDYNINAAVAFEVCMDWLAKSVINKNGNEVKVETPLKLSMHSYNDIMDACSRGITPSSHFYLLSLLFEQICYKTNPQCEYDDCVIWETKQSHR